MKISVEQIAFLISGIVDGDPTATIHTAGKIENANKGEIAFYSNPKYEEYIYSTNATAVIVQHNFKPKKPINTTLIRVDDPYSAFSKLLEEYQKMIKEEKIGVEEPSFVGNGTTIGERIFRGAFSYIGHHCHIGSDVKVYPQVWIGENVTVGNDTIIFSGAKIYPGSVIGANCVIHAGAVIGSDGFGFAPQADGTYKTIPQLGNVILEDNVSIGANTTIDCATTGSTIIRKGTKLDNLVMVAHNVEIGANTVIAAQAGISGSSKLGNNCILGGQVGIAGHLHIAGKTSFAAQSGMMKNVAQENTVWLGSPAFENKQYLRSYSIFRNLPDLKERISKLEKGDK
jgi:UDP-3-O-[3-hydroxymyristoyl] glucosamine N-acyltransferase